ncbi:Hpt domain-containing protein [Thermoproteota archaeon]
MTNEHHLDPIIVEIDPDIEDLVPNFINKRKHDIEAVKEAVKNKDSEFIKITAHKMKGSCGLYGFTGLSAIARDIENKVKAGLLEEIPDDLELAKDYLARLKPVVKE